MKDVLFTPTEIVEWLKIKMPTLRRWQREGLPCFRAGRLCRYEREKVREWLEQRAQKKQ